MRKQPQSQPFDYNQHGSNTDCQPEQHQVTFLSSPEGEAHGGGDGGGDARRQAESSARSLSPLRSRQQRIQVQKAGMSASQ